MKFKKTIIVVTMAIMAFLVICGSYFYSQKKAADDLIESMRAYEEGTKPLSDIRDDFKEDSLEYQLFQGIEAAEKGNYEEAQAVFQEAEEKAAVNPAVSVYLAYYENEWAYSQAGTGNYDTMVKFFGYLSKCRPLYNDTDLIWEVAGTLIDTEADRERIIFLLNHFIDDAIGLSTEARLTVLGNIGMLHLMNDNYSESVFAFRTVIDEAKYIKDPDQRNYLKIRALEYLGNLYEVLDELESAIKIYDAAIGLEISDKELEASAKYASYINRNTCYIDLEAYEQARQSGEEAKAIIEYLPENMKAGVELFQYNNDAYLALSENDIEKAEADLETCYRLLEKVDKESFLNNELYVELTDLQIKVKKGDYASALEKANNLLRICEQYNAGFRVAIYLSILEIYDKTDQENLYAEAATALIAEKDAASHVLKKDYVQYVNSKYEMQLLGEDNQRLAIIILAALCLLLIVCLAIVIMGLYYRKMKNDTRLDGLTQVYNRKFLEKDLKKMFQRRLKNMQWGVLMVDVDYFKKFNDFYGHTMGDMVIKEVAASLKSSVKKGDMVIRYGGEEFLIVLKNSDEDGVYRVCEGIQKEIAEKQIPHERSEVSPYVSLSMGAAVGVISDYQNLQDYIKKADACMYASKQKGRNCFHVAVIERPENTKIIREK